MSQNNLKNFIKRAGFETRKEFAFKLGLDPIRVSQWVHGTKIPPKYAEEMCKLLNCHPKELGFGDEYEEQKMKAKKLVMRLNIALIMKERDIKSAEVARRIGLSKQYLADKNISDITKPFQDVSMELIEKIANAIGVSIEDLEEMPIPKNEEVKVIREYIKKEEDMDFESEWFAAKEILPRKDPRKKIILMEDTELQMRLYHNFLENTLNILDIDNILIQPTDKASVGAAIVEAEQEDVKLVIMDLMLSDIPNSLEYFTRNVPRGDFKIIVMSAIEDEEEISKIKLHPRVSGFIKKGSQDPYQWIKFTKILTDLFK